MRSGWGDRSAPRPCESWRDWGGGCGEECKAPYSVVADTHLSEAVASPEPLVAQAMILRRLKNFVAMLGLKDASGRAFHIHPHMFRRTFARYVARHDTTNLLALKEHFKHVSLSMTDYYVGNDLELWMLMEEEERLFFESFDKALRADQLAGPGGVRSEEKDRRGDCGRPLAEGLSRRSRQPSAQGDDPRSGGSGAARLSLRGVELLLVPSGIGALHRRESADAQTLQSRCVYELDHHAGAQASLGKGRTRLRGTDGAEAPGGALPKGAAGHPCRQQQNPAGSDMKASAKKLAGLRRYHADRPVKTRLKLLEALDRMESGHTVVVGPEFKWSKTTLAREAGVNINTVVRKLPSGEWAFPEINDRFEELRHKRRQVVTGSDAKEEKIAELRNEVERLREQNRLLALEINRIGQQVLEERERAERMTVYERQNASLREEISRIQAGGGTPLKVVARHED